MSGESDGRRPRSGSRGSTSKVSIVSADGLAEGSVSIESYQTANTNSSRANTGARERLNQKTQREEGHSVSNSLTISQSQSRSQSRNNSVSERERERSRERRNSRYSRDGGQGGGRDGGRKVEVGAEGEVGDDVYQHLTWVETLSDRAKLQDFLYRARKNLKKSKTRYNWTPKQCIFPSKRSFASGSPKLVVMYICDAPGTPVKKLHSYTSEGCPWLGAASCSPARR